MIIRFVFFAIQNLNQNKKILLFVVENVLIFYQNKKTKKELSKGQRNILKTMLKLII